MIDTTASPASGIQVVPHFADGGGWTTQILLVNPTSTPMAGNLQFSGPDGTAANVSIAGQTGASFAYSIAPRSSQRLSTAGAPAATATGSVRVVPAGGAAPTPLVIFSYRPVGITLSEAGVPATAAPALRVYAESSGTLGQPGNIQSGIAIANVSSSPATVTFELTQLNGSPVAGLSPASLNLAGSAQTSKFLAELFPALPNPFEGVLRNGRSEKSIGLKSISPIDLRIWPSALQPEPQANSSAAASPNEAMSYRAAGADNGKYLLKRRILINIRRFPAARSIRHFRGPAFTSNVPGA